MTSGNVINVISILVSLGVGVAVYSLKTTIRVAILEAGEKAADKYATKDELTATEERLNRDIGIRNEIRTGFERMGVMRSGDGKMG